MTCRLTPQTAPPSRQSQDAVRRSEPEFATSGLETIPLESPRSSGIPRRRESAYRACERPLQGRRLPLPRRGFAITWLKTEFLRRVAVLR
jgi:hypothetical protein